MTETLAATVLGLVEGVTEFLPVSSTGHLILAGHLIGFTGDKADSFEVIIQLGAILAVVVLYWKRFWWLLSPKPLHAFSGLRGIWLLFLTSLPAGLVGLVARKTIKAYLFGPITVALALAVGALMIFWVERRRMRDRYYTLDEITPALAFGIGCFQCLSLWPGFSRSAATIMGGMLLGAKRSLAAEYSFIAAVPIMFAATAYDFYKSAPLYSADDLGILAIGFVVSFLAALAAVKGFIVLVKQVSLRPFAWYRLALAAAVFFFWPK
ncbi:undecaprenol kinase [Solidesulfovibrio carbinoliphilus subsp. oakridgensis]|uniref:Undecaprenyl-diphosphatase n=1 Tax=Solidesulfovibrio carbinoliphilus subsp. oakridgensis TaxID=694327 RepID=G7Q5X4_9BACT|nr:undecaprenyl-diphosphate phosphatase [Solidesulfovibrio carbinoliphilus]EHJ46911.1 undecaprenol kinase [Solidesulfovibrio carbinoliphilus subsp. oakridgensis]